MGYALALMASGCASRPLKGAKAVITRKPTGQVEQTLVQGENPSQASKQTQETVKVRTYTVPAGSRLEQPPSAASPARLSTINSQPINLQPPSELNSQPINLSQPPTSYVLSSPMPVGKGSGRRFSARNPEGRASQNPRKEARHGAPVPRHPRIPQLSFGV